MIIQMSNASKGVLASLAHCSVSIYLYVNVDGAELDFAVGNVRGEAPAPHSRCHFFDAQLRTTISGLREDYLEGQTLQDAILDHIKLPRFVLEHPVKVEVFDTDYLSVQKENGFNPEELDGWEIIGGCQIDL